MTKHNVGLQTPCSLDDVTKPLLAAINDISISVDPSFGSYGFECLETLLFRKQYLFSEVLSKYTEMDTASAGTRRAAAIAKWLQTEARNAKTNQRVLLGETWFGKERIHSESVLNFASSLIAKVIGHNPPEVLFGGFTNGASTSQPRHPSGIARKLTEQADVTERCMPYAMELMLRNAGGWFIPYARESFPPRTVDGNVMFTVRKNAQIDRVACKEPDLNLWCQKAYGNFIRRRLRKWGIDLNDQSNNQQLSKAGSESGRYATLDLSSASDSVTTALVCRLLPPGWFVCLDAVRSEFTLIDDVWHENQMFSSMGNGFTFELESLIFWALSRSVAYHLGVPGRILVYGDDIIVPTAVSGILIQVLGFCGFLTNPKKTFLEGHFRESCGAHWYRGFDVKPVYLREPVVDAERAIIWLNQMRRWISVHMEIVEETGLRADFSDVISTWYSIARKCVPRKVWGGRYLDRSDSLVTKGNLGTHVVQRVSRRLRSLESELNVGIYLSYLDGGSPPLLVTSSSLRVAENGLTALSDPPRFVVPSGTAIRKRKACYWTSVEIKPTW